MTEGVGTEVQKRRVTIAIVIVTLLLTALFVARGTTRLLATLIPLEATARASTRPTAVAALPERRHRDPMPILHRNIFDSASGPQDGTQQEAETTAAPEQAGPVEDPNAPPPACEGSLRLVGAFALPSRPDLSFASITDATGKAKLYRPGGLVDGRTVIAIGSQAVLLRPSGGRSCSLAMFRPAQSGAPTSTAQTIVASAAGIPPAPELPAEDGGPISSADMDRGIQRVSDTNFGVTREFLNRVLENQAAILTSARVVPHTEGDRTVGVKIYGIRRNALLSRLGLQNGDVLRTINGYDMTNPTGALEAYSRLRDASHLTVSLIRRGSAQTIDYNIR